jgi:tRNA threonylcarbamoyl adenosine modification protein YjeE
MPDKKIHEWRVKRGDLSHVAAFVASEVRLVNPFVLWLKGELGAGKTTFAGALLRALGLPPSVPVLSPTFTFMTEYQTSFGLVAHIDLYRLTDNDNDAVDFLLSDRNFCGLIIEWPERAAQANRIQKTHELVLKFADHPEERFIQFYGEK